MSDRYFRQLVYTSFGAQRFTQDSPIMPDVWVSFGKLALDASVGKRLPVLLTPYDGCPPGELAQVLRDQLNPSGTGTSEQSSEKSGARVAINQTVVAADLLFHELIEVVLPLSYWWSKRVTQLAEKQKKRGFRSKLTKAIEEPKYFPTKPTDLRADVVWLARVVGTIAALYRFPEIRVSHEGLSLAKQAGGSLTQKDFKDNQLNTEIVVESLLEIVNNIEYPGAEEKPMLWSVHQNRETEASLFSSRPTVKADATQSVFEVTGKGITWAVIDSGIDACHIALRKRDEHGTPNKEAFEKKTLRSKTRWINHSRVRETYDFVQLRDLLSLGENDEISDEIRARLKAQDIDPNSATETLRAKIVNGKFIDWDTLIPFLRVPHKGEETAKKKNSKKGAYVPPVFPHGTHVAGIIGADWRVGDKETDKTADVGGRNMTGIAPDIEFIDIRVLDEHGRASEFSIMAGMQFVRYLNSIHELRHIHGVNLSFSLRHDFTVFACGATPICEEAERLVHEGTVVVTVAGNEGMARYQMVEEKTGLEREMVGYRAISITDPGNAEKVITVGSTHCREPHTFGVSYFSSRGPTGDGRMKPDIVAPGEKIVSLLPNNQSGQMDGTSQAAPHVSGAAALLMQRNPEMVGNPMRIKKIFCDTATDLGRERYFQGAGLIDILRAIQSI